MRKGLLLKISLPVVAGIVLIFIVFGVNLIYKFYNDIFRLSYNQVQKSLSTKISPCKKIIDCKLVSGDILIRRYITERTWLVDKLAHPYFTHSAFYLGDDQIVEAIGTEKNPKDEIQIATLSKSDWLYSDVKNFVIIRPKYTTEKLETIKRNLKNIAEDPDYKFGLPQQENKRATCADLIFKQLYDANIVNVSSVPRIITPDYLFWLSIQNQRDFEIIGYNIPIEK